MIIEALTLSMLVGADTLSRPEETARRCGEICELSFVFPKSKVLEKVKLPDKAVDFYRDYYTCSVERFSDSSLFLKHSDEIDKSLQRIFIDCGAKRVTGDRKFLQELKLIYSNEKSDDQLILIMKRARGLFFLYIALRFYEKKGDVRRVLNYVSGVSPEMAEPFFMNSAR